MIKLIPNYINKNAPRSEQKVFELLEKSKNPRLKYIFHSLNLPSHAYKSMAEIDFLIVHETGMIVLEIKGGGVSCNENGIWTTVDRYGEQHSLSSSPWEQSKSAMFALKNILMESSRIYF